MLKDNRKQNWAQYMENGKVSPEIRPEIVESWSRCDTMKVDIGSGKGSVASNDELQKRLEGKKELLSIARPVMEDIFEIIKKTSYSVVLTDEDGVLLDIIINQDIQEKHESLNFFRGTFWDEKNVGTNAIGTCLAIDKPMQVIGADHYCLSHHQWTCSAAPIHDTNGRIIGCLDLSGRVEDVHTHTYGIVVSAVKNIEKQLAILESYRLMDIALDSILDGLMIIDTDMKIKRINNKIPELFKMDEEDVYKVDMNKVLKDVDIVNNIFINKHKFRYSDITLSLEHKKIECFLNITPIVFNEEVMGAVLVIREAKQVRKEINKLAGFKANYTFDNIITKNDRMIELINTAKRISNTNCSVLIEGESGTGKELFAQSIHNESHRKKGPFIAINCAAIPKDLVESELFGYENGSFTGALKGGMPGKFEMASGGTLFLDEIGEIPLEIQPKLLRVLDNNKVVRIGGSYERDLDVRIIAATNRNLLDEMSKTAFRQDLYFRLNVINLRLLPLKRRKEDIIELAKYFLGVLNQENNGMLKRFSSSFEQTLLEHDWAGNVRELKNIIQRAYYLSVRDIIDNAQLPNASQSKISLAEDTGSESLKDMEKNSIEHALHLNKGNAVKAAESLNISKATIYRKIKTYSIDVHRI
ncbi:MAG: sigma 54-interacting transcriptional regulator [Eubacteriaceae bacterium]|nr:sigma 54-interacting transcriptional regulator [Eubacteriaceae bacterium]